MAEGRITGFYGPLLLYIVGLNVLVIAAAALLHELGHAALGHWMGCNNIEIVLFSSDVQSTFSQMTCMTGTEPGALPMFLSSFIFLFPLSGLFFVLGRFKERYLGHIVLGVSIMVSATDMSLFVQSRGVELLTMAVGGAIAIYGEERLINGIIATELTAGPEYGG